MKHQKVVTALLLIVLVVVAFFVAYHISSQQKPATSKPFYVGIEVGWNATLADYETLINTVKSYTNLLLIASPTVIVNETLLYQTCDYAYNAGMYFMPVYYQQINNAASLGYTPESWLESAYERYGNHLLGIYYFDEPGGNQLDMTKILPEYPVTSKPQSYLDYANYFFWLWGHGSGGVETAANDVHSINTSLSMLTADYGLYWFDYKLGYDTDLAEFGSNNSRPLQISLVRGAAQVQNKSWGALIDWTYNYLPYLESPTEMYNDMVLAYDSGASYIAIYDSSHDYANTTLNKTYYAQLQNFWKYVKQNADKHGSLKADTAVVLPQDYGFGFRNPDDSVWQYHNATAWTQKLYSDITSLLNESGSKLDIVYGDPQFQSAIQSSYGKILYWPQDFENGVTYPVIDVNNGLGYNTIQDAVSSFGTYEGDNVLVKPGTYSENVAVTKPVTLTSQNKNTTIIEGLDNGTALTVAADNVTVNGFTIKNIVYPSTTVGTGLLLEGVHNCTVTDNVVTENYVGVLLANSTDNMFRNNEISGNTYNLILQNSSPNDIDASNTIDGQPYTTA
ncbi:MAG TPA: NosD domain-containing protein [Candidatus Limnocylindrales bacterium]|nr:NosD domain-containing protein [Candidatus Limnocylindrales bacterium]